MVTAQKLKEMLEQAASQVLPQKVKISKHVACWTMYGSSLTISLIRHKR